MFCFTPGGAQPVPLVSVEDTGNGIFTYVDYCYYSDSVRLPCLTIRQGETVTRPCELVGCVYDGLFLRGPVVPDYALTEGDPVAYLVDGYLTATVAGFGLVGQPFTMVCIDPSC